MNISIPVDLLAGLSQYPESFRSLSWQRRTESGSFSGATLWQATDSLGRMYALKAHPPGKPDEMVLSWQHSMLKRARSEGLQYIPQIYPASDGFSFADSQQRFWELSDWIDGDATFIDPPSERKIQDAMIAIARLHQVWQQESTSKTCPAIERRLQILQPAKPIQPASAVATFSVTSWAEWSRDWMARFEPIRNRLQPHAIQTLNQLRQGEFIVQPVHGDLWADHLLFREDRLTGIIDFAAMKIDHVASDLARLLGSSFPKAASERKLALQLYRELTGQGSEFEILVDALDWTGILAAGITWYRRLATESASIVNSEATQKRCEQILDRLKLESESIPDH